MDTANIPCVVFAYNRPKKLMVLLRALRHQEISNLIIFIDGPKNIKDEKAVNRCRDLAESINWANTQVIINTTNEGPMCFIDRISAVFKDYQQAVFLEDDCLPSPSFYNFMCQSLNRYQKDKRVFSIGGYQPISKRYFLNYPYNLVSCARFMGWGWATWKNRWQMILENLPNLSPFSEKRDLSDIAGFDLQIQYQLILSGEENKGWDSRVAIISIWNKMVHLLPTIGQIRNIGFDRNGTHYGRLAYLLNLFFHNRNIGRMPNQAINWLEDTRIDCKYNQELRSFIRKVHSTTFRTQINRIQRKVKYFFTTSYENKTDLNLIGSDSKTWKRALLSYISHAFSISRYDFRIYHHINVWHAQEIVKVLNRLGYLVDVVDYQDANIKLKREYDLFIGNGGNYFTSICRYLPQDVPKIYLATTSYWKFHNEQENQRSVEFFNRHGKKTRSNRYLPPVEEENLNVATGIIGLGNSFTKNTYKNFERKKFINGNALYDDFYNWCNKDFELGRKNFLFFSGRGNVHKGLDLILEAFSELDSNIWIITKLENDMLSIYSKLIRNAKNIHIIGWIPPRTKKYYDIIARCNYSILPSCSEGQSQSILECMWQGLIPIVSPECGLDVENFGYEIQPCTINNIRELVTKLSTLPQDVYERKSKLARIAAINKYSEKTFSIGFEQELISLIKH